MAAVPMEQPAAEHPLPLTGERTMPDIDHEHYWFTRHLAAYRWAGQFCRGTVLDAGAGEGYGTAELAKEATLAIAMDLDHRTCAHAMRRYPEVVAITGNLWSWPLATASVDVVISMQVIEHLWDPSAFFAEAHRCLRPGGLLVVSTPNRLTFSPGLARGERPLNPFHVEEFDGAQLVGMVVHQDFQQITLTGVLDGAGDALDQELMGHSSPADWSTTLRERVARTSVADFPIAEVVDPNDPGQRILDLIVTARTGDDAG